MKLGFYYHVPAIERNGKIFMPGYLGRFIDSLAAYYESIILFLHFPDKGSNSKFDYEINSDNIFLVSLPARGSVPYRIIHKRLFLKIIKQHLSKLDAIFLRGPSPLIADIARVTHSMPKIFLIVGDMLAGIDSLPQPRWRKELIRLWSRYNNQRQLLVMKDNLVFVNSRALYMQFEGKVRKLVETHTTTINSEDFYYRDDTCQSKPIRLLYTGRLDQAKGLLDLVTSLSILINQGEDIVLDLVGWAEKDSRILQLIFDLAKKEGVKDRINFHGYKAVGPELFEFYKNSDIYIIASQSSFEGFPRTVWEAMANSLPVVATKVGSIPDYIFGAAELVEPKNPKELAGGISRVLNNVSVRQEYISKGFLLAKQSTLETQAGRMANAIADWINRNNA